MSWLSSETADDELAEGQEEDVSIVLLCSRNAAGVHFFPPANHPSIQRSSLSLTLPHPDFLLI